MIAKSLYKNIVSIFVLSLLLTNYSYAETSLTPELQIKTLQYEIKQQESLKEVNIQVLIELYTKLLESQINAKLYSEAIDSAIVLEKLNCEFYGDNSKELFQAKLDTLGLYVDTNSELQRKSKLDEIGSLVGNMPVELKIKYYYQLYYYYANYEDMQMANDILIKIYSCSCLSLDDKINVVEKLSENYSYLKDIKNTNKFLSEYYKLVSVQPDPYGRLTSFYIRKIYLNNDVQNLYKDFMPLYVKAKNNVLLLKNNDDIKSNLNHLDLYLVNNYLEMGEFQKAKDIIDEFEKTNRYDIAIKWSLYDSYYDKIKNYSERKKSIDYLKRDLKKTSDFSYQDQITINEKYASYYKDTEDYKKSEKLLLEIINIIDEYFNANPARKYDFYISLAALCINKGDYDSALEYINIANNTYRHKTGSYTYARMLYYKANALYGKGQNQEALQYLLDAEKVQIKLPTSFDLADTYETMYNLYASQKDFVNAFKYFDKYLNIKEQQYGKNNVNVYKALLNKVDLISTVGCKNNADKLLNSIISDLIAGKVQGIDYEFYSYINLKIAYLSYEKEHYDQALEYVNEALKYSYTSEQFKEIYNLLSDIYDKQGKTTLKLKYKLLAKKA